MYLTFALSEAGIVRTITTSDLRCGIMAKFVYMRIVRRRH